MALTQSNSHKFESGELVTATKLNNVKVVQTDTATNNNSFTGTAGQLTYDTTSNKLRVHDGTTAGGNEVGAGDGGVTSSSLADNAVTTAKIADGAVTSAKLAGGASQGFPSDDIFYAPTGITSIADTRKSNLLITNAGAGATLQGQINASSSPYGNIVIGKNAGRSMTSTGSDQIGANIAIGDRALDDIFHNIPADNGCGGAIAIGANSMCGFTGIRSIGIGFGAGKVSDTALNPYDNCSQIGANSVATDDNQVVLGNSSISSLRCNVQTISSLSDKRTKKDISDNELGLKFINALKTVQFKKKNPKDWEESILENRFKDEGKEAEIALSKDDPKLYRGLIAQDVEKVLADQNIEEWDGFEDDGGLKRLGYSSLVVPLIKAVQELSARVETLEGQLA